MKQVLKKANVLVVFFLAMAYLGCEDVNNMFPDVLSAFTYTVNEDTGKVTFINVSEEADSYVWDFGDGSSSTEINPIKIYAASGTYTVTLKAINASGASDTSQDEVTVTITTGGGGGDCDEETSQSLDAADFNLTFQADPGAAVTADGAALTVIDNPDTDNAVNSSCKVGEIVRDASLPFANTQITFDSKFDFAANSGFKIKVWAPVAGTNVLLKLEDKADAGINTEVAAVTASGNAWEELTFDFPDTESGKYDKIVLFFDINTDSGATYYIDDFALNGGGGDCTAETEQSLSAEDLNLTFQTDPGAAVTADGAVLTVIDNPDTDNAVNSSCKVGEIVRDASLPFANTQITFDSKFDFAANSGFKLKVWAPVAGTNVLLKLEDKADAGINTEVGAVTTTGTAWEELTFDFPDTASGKYDKIVLFFDITTDSGATYYIDDFTLNSGGGATCTPETEQSLSATDFNLTFLTDPGTAILEDGAAYSYIDNPDFDNDVNASCKVGEIVRDASLPFANNQIVFDAKFDFTANSGFKLKVWAPAVGTNVLLKLEDKADSGINTEVGAVTTTANAWEELTFDFPGTESGKYDKIVLFFDITTDSGATYYFDDFALYGTGSGGGSALLELPISFDDAGVNYNFSVFNGASYQVVDNPDLSGVNNVASKVGEIVNAGGAFEGGAFSLDTPVDFSGDKAITMKFYSTVAVPVLMKFEGAVPAVETTASHGGTGWEQLTFTFTSSDQFDTLVLFVDGPGTTAGTFYMDDIEQVPAGGGGGGGTAATFPLDFEDGVLFFNAFEGATVAVIDNPQATGNPSSKVLEMVKPAGVPFFAGINSDPALNGPVIDFANGLVFTMKVWSPKAGISVRMRLEQEPGVVDPPAYEIFQTLASANEWVTLTFDFSTTPALSTYSYTRLVLNADWGTDPAGGETFYIDDIEQGAGAPPPPGLELPIDFDGSGVTYDFVTFNGASYSVVDNPFLSGVNAAASKVGQIVNVGGAYEGGAFTLDTPVDFTTDKDITMKFYSTVAVPVLLKFEGAGAPVETTANHGGSGWEQLTFSFTTSDQFGTLVLFVDGPGTTAGTFYMDDIEQVAGAGGGGGGAIGSELTINGDFELGDLTGWTSFAPDNNGTFEVTTAQANGGIYSGLVIADVDGIGSPSFPVVKQANIGVGTITPNTSVTITFDLYGSVAGAGGVVFAEFFSELSGGGVSKSEILGGGPLFPNATWTTYSFTTTTGADVTGGVTLQLKADCGGNAGCKIDAYFDNVSVTIN